MGGPGSFYVRSNYALMERLSGQALDFRNLTPSGKKVTFLFSLGFFWNFLHLDSICPAPPFAPRPPVSGPYSRPGNLRARRRETGVTWGGGVLADLHLRQCRPSETPQVERSGRPLPLNPSPQGRPQALPGKIKDFEAILRNRTTPP